MEPAKIGRSLTEQMSEFDTDGDAVVDEEALLDTQNSGMDADLEEAPLGITDEDGEIDGEEYVEDGAETDDEDVGNDVPKSLAACKNITEFEMFAATRSENTIIKYLQEQQAIINKTNDLSESTIQMANVIKLYRNNLSDSNPSRATNVKFSSFFSKVVNQIEQGDQNIIQEVSIIFPEIIF